MPDDSIDSNPTEYVGIVAVVEAKLLRKITDPAEVDNMNLEIALLIPTLLVQVPCLGSDYLTIAGQDKTFFDGAVGRLVAARLRPAQLAAENDGKGQLIENDIDGVRKKYAGYNAGRGKNPSVEEQWAAEATQSLEAIVELRRLARLRAGQTRPPSFVGLPGRRRAESARSNSRPIDLRDLLLPRNTFLNRE